MSTPLSFGHWSDPLCIWAYAAQHVLDRLLAEMGEHLHVDYHVVPVFGSVSWRFRKGPWSSEGPSGRAGKTREIAERLGHPEVSGRCWLRDLPASSWAPAAAIKAVCAIERAGELPPGMGGEYQKRLRARFFVDEVNIARREEQLALAETLGVPRSAIEQRLDDGSALAALWEDYTEKERLRIQGSPTYVFDGGRAMLYGNVAYGVLHATVDELLRGGGPTGSAC